MVEPARKGFVGALTLAVLLGGAVWPAFSKTITAAPQGGKEVGPDLAGTLTFKPGDKVDFSGLCGKAKISLKDHQAVFDLQKLEQTDLVDPKTKFGYIHAVPNKEIPGAVAKCYGIAGDGPDNLQLIFKKVSGFTPKVSGDGKTRTAIIAKVMLRRIEVAKKE